MNTRATITATVVAAVAASTLAATPTQANGPTDRPAPRDISFETFDGRADFRTGHAADVRVRGSRLALANDTDRTVTYKDPFGDAGKRRYDVGSWTSPVVELGFGATQAVPSWNADTPTGTWVETRFRGRHADGSWTKWYVMGRWTSGMAFEKGDIHRTSVEDQGDADGTVYTDTFAAEDGREVDAYQTRVRLMRPKNSHTSPRVSAIGAMASADAGDPLATSEPILKHKVELDVPQFSQNIHKGEYPEFGGGGAVWCSPTSSTMVQYFWGRKHQVKKKDLRDIEAPNGDPQVDYAAMHTWDYAYDGAGNWPYNAAYASTYGLQSFVTRLRSLAEIERFVGAGIPVVVSLAFTEEEMPEAGYSTDGHLMVVRGFTKAGDPILNDPASDSNEAVRNVYTRENFERVWQQSSEGVVYIYRPHNVALPENVQGATENW
ncbi:MAG: C39 family peptidase [Nocardioidaceae bacterium]